MKTTKILLPSAVCCLSLLSAVFLLLTLSAHARTWTAKSGHTIDGEFVTLEGKTVSIKQTDGKPVAIELDRLSDADQQFVKDEMKKRENPFVVVENTETPEESDAEKLLQRGMSALEGKGVPKDEEEAVKYFRKAAELGHVQAQMMLAVCYDTGTGVREDAAEAAKWLHKVAEQGIALAQFRLGMRYTQGTGVAKDLEEAFKWFRKAAEQEYVEAQHKLGMCYLQGTGVAKDEKTAVQWFHKAAEQGFALSRYNLGLMYENGDGVSQDLAQAKEWYRKAAEQNFEKATEALQRLEEGAGDNPFVIIKNEENPFVINKTTDTPDSDHKAGDRMTLKIKEVEYAFRWCPAGKFMMGSPESESNFNDGETQFQFTGETQHQVTLTRGFWMLETEVTQGMWEKVMGNNPSHSKGAKLPVEQVSWNDCQEYIKKLNDLGVTPAGCQFSLPTEAQWEYACRAGTTTAFHFGNTLDKDKANYNSILGKTTNVGNYPANAWGLRDMHGNVREWCVDWGSDYPGNAETDPSGAVFGSRRVVRGGDWFFNAQFGRSASRHSEEPTERGLIFGLRLCLVSESKSEAAAQMVERTRQAAEQGDTEAQYHLGRYYHQGIGVEQDYKESVKWFLKAAEQGHAEAQYHLGECFLNGTGVAKDEEKAKEWFHKAAEQGNKIAHERLKQVDIAQLHKAAEQGDAEAQYTLGESYLRAKNVELDFTEAVKWYRKAAEQGHAEAQYKLGARYANGTGVTKDEKEAAKWFRKAAEQGHVEAQFTLGWWYHQGTGVEQDYKEAFKWFLKAAEQGHVTSQRNLGVYYGAGTGVEQDDEKATQWYRKAAEQGDTEALYIMGARYYQGIGVAQDREQAIKWWRKAAEQNHAKAKEALQQLESEESDSKKLEQLRKSAEQGDAEAQNDLGVRYINGDGVAQDNEEAVKWYRKAAEQGYVYAQLNLGACYENGVGVPQDGEEAAKWFRKAAEQDHADAQLSLGMCYYNGTGVAQDYEEAAKWFRKAAEQGHAQAQSNMGACYYYGKGIAQDYEEAVRWYRKGAEQGDAYAQNNLGWCYIEGNGVAKDGKEAVKWFLKAVEQGIAVAQSNMGECYLNGVGVEKDEAQAVQWFLKAAEQEFAEAQYFLGKCYEEGTGVPQDKDKAVEWYRKAAEQDFEKAIEALKRLEGGVNNKDNPFIIINKTTDTPDSDRKAGDRMTLKIKEVEYAFRWCPAGKFMMGSPESSQYRESDETQHQVTFTQGFWMLETEVTQMMWMSVTGDNPSNFKGAKLPVEQVSWNDCQEHIKKLNALLAGTPGMPAGFKFSLPTEAQWEYACRAGTTTAFHFGNTLEKDKANFDKGQLTEVGHFPANAWGLHEMHGNVWEWCLDWHGDYPSGAVTDPTGADDGWSRVIRGGGWQTEDRGSCRSANRDCYLPSYQGKSVGFRLALVSESKSEGGDDPFIINTTQTDKPEPEPPQPQPPSGGIAAKLVGSWSSLGYDVVARNSDLRIWTFNGDGTFKLVLLTHLPKERYHKGNYSVSNGKITFTNIVFTNENYNVVEKCPDTVVECEFRRGVEGESDEFDLNKILSGTNFFGTTTWRRTPDSENNPVSVNAGRQ